MNRIIKFRIWFRGEMIHFNLGDIEETGVVWNKDHTRVACVSGNCEERHDIMQFTGLLDKNGKEIYESDLVNVGGAIYKVGWYAMNASFSLVTVTPAPNGMASAGIPVRDWNWLDGGKAVHFHNSTGKSPQVEVIGNIYENPELLKQ